MAYTPPSKHVSKFQIVKMTPPEFQMVKNLIATFGTHRLLTLLFHFNPNVTHFQKFWEKIPPGDIFGPTFVGPKNHVPSIDDINDLTHNLINFCCISHQVDF